MRQKIKTFTLLVTLCCSVLAGLAQQFELPQNITLDKAGDYVKYEKDIIAAANWLESTPIGKEDDKRKQVSTFIMQWITGSPTVTIELNANGLTKIADKNPEMLLMFMAGYTRYALQNNYLNDKVKCSVEGMKSVLNLYKAGGDVKKNKTIEKAIAAGNEGKFEDWVNENIIAAK